MNYICCLWNFVYINWTQRYYSCTIWELEEIEFRILDMQTLAYEGFTVGLVIIILEYKECLMILKYESYLQVEQ